MRPFYIGITDFTSPDQVRDILSCEAPQAYQSSTSHRLGVGVMMSHKTLNGLPTKWSKAFPPNDKIASMFIDDLRVFNILHYADYEGVTSRHDIDRAIKFGGSNLDAIQLDMIWPDMVTQCAGTWDSRVTRGPKLIKVILQVGSAAMSRMGDNPKRVARALVEYWSSGFIDYVLLDRSGGEGKPMDSKLLIQYYREIRYELPNIGIVVAGGLGPSSLDLLEWFRHEEVHLDLNIDAQSRLRPSGSALDPIDWTMAKDYYMKARAFFGEA